MKNGVLVINFNVIDCTNLFFIFNYANFLESKFRISHIFYVKIYEFLHIDFQWISTNIYEILRIIAVSAQARISCS